MSVNFRLLAACCLLTAATARALAQPTTPATTAPAAASLPTHAIRSINPVDTDFSDLEFLRQEIGGARVVMLGEPTHGVGTATEANRFCPARCARECPVAGPEADHEKGD